MSIDDILADVNAKVHSVTERAIIRDMVAAQTMGAVYCSRIFGMSTRQYRHSMMQAWCATSKMKSTTLVLGLQHATLMMARAVEKLYKEAE